MRLIARAIRPVMVRLFPNVPAEHPAMSAMIMNMAANALGLGNAATPMGIKAMMELDRLNPNKGEATDAMCLFLAINTSSVTLLPLGVIGVRASAGAAEPAAILIPTLVATICSTAVAIAASKTFVYLRGQEPQVATVASNPEKTKKDSATLDIEDEFTFGTKIIRKIKGRAVMTLPFGYVVRYLELGSIPSAPRLYSGKT